MIIDVNQKCIKCGKPVSNDEIGLYKKMVNRGAEEFMCIDCLSERFGITTEKAQQLIEQFRESGCTLFAK